MRIVGIDYSLSCPAICIKEGGYYSLHYLTSIKKHVGYKITKNPNFSIIGESHIKEYSCNEERFDNIGEWALSLLEPTDIVNIEGYAFAAAGLVFNLAENTGLLKHKLWKAGIKYHITPPSAVKKFATTKGSANKELMCSAFVSHTGFDIFEVFNTKKPVSPINDICDAYWMCKFLESILKLPELL
jgi:Holliday junction resolvasome RuvABC endonuclease subunit